MTKQIITESELKARIASLQQKMAAMEDAASVGKTIGNAAGQAAGAVAAAPQAVANTASNLWNQAKAGVTGAAQSVSNAAQGAVQGVQNFAQGVAGGAKQGYAAATAPAGQAAAKPGTTTAAKSDPNVMALQQKLIAAGAKIKADGVMGPATRAAQQQFPQVTGQSPEEQAVAKDLLSANDGSTTQGAAAAPRDPNAGQAAAPAGATTPAPAAAAPAAEPNIPESVSYRDMDSLARIVQLSR